MTTTKALLGAVGLAAAVALLASPARAAWPVDGNEQQDGQDDAATVSYELGVDPQTDRILREAGEYLSRLEEFGFRADVRYDVATPDGQKLSYGGVVEASVRRPNGLHVKYVGDERTSTVVYDGETFTFYDVNANVYAQTDVRGDLDAALDTVFDRFGFSVPIADLVYSNPYLVLSEDIEDGFLVGRHAVLGMPRLSSNRSAWRTIRFAATLLFSMAFVAAGIAGLLGALINKAAPIP